METSVTKAYKLAVIELQADFQSKMDALQVGFAPSRKRLEEDYWLNCKKVKGAEYRAKLAEYYIKDNLLVTEFYSSKTALYLDNLKKRNSLEARYWLK